MKKINLKSKKWEKTYKFIIIILLIIFIAFLLYLFVFGKRLNTEGEVATNLYSYLGSEDIKVCDGYYNYSENKILNSDVKADVKSCYAYYNSVDDVVNLKIDKTKKKNTCKINGLVFATENEDDTVCSITKIDGTKLHDTYFKMYNEVTTFETFNLDSNHICYYAEDGFYYCGLLETYTYTFGSDPVTYRSIKKVVEKGDNIIIYDYFLKVNNELCYQSFYTSTDVKNCSKEISNKAEINYAFLRKYGKLYKHIFKKDADGSYYWYSSEPV